MNAKAVLIVLMPALLLAFAQALVKTLKVLMTGTGLTFLTA